MLKVTFGFDDEETGTATLAEDGSVQCTGNAQNTLDTWPHLKGENLLRHAAEVCNGRGWANLEEDAKEGSALEEEE